MSLVLTLLENNDPFDTVVYKGGSNGEGSKKGSVEQQQQQVLGIGFSVRGHYRSTANWLQVHISSWEKQGDHLVALLLELWEEKLQ